MKRPAQGWIEFFCFFFFVWIILKVFIEFVTILLLFHVLVFWPEGMWDLRCPTRNQTHTPGIGRQSLSRWTSAEVPGLNLNKEKRTGRVGWVERERKGVEEFMVQGCILSAVMLGMAPEVVEIGGSCGYPGRSTEVRK